MTLYFSGISSRVEASYLRSAGVEYALVDPKDVVNVFDNDVSWFPHTALDSGAYRAFRRDQQVDVNSYLGLTSYYRPHMDFMVMPDIIDQPAQTFLRWQSLKAAGLADRFVPVWAWGYDLSMLDAYLQDAPLVAIGGLVPLMRAKNEATLNELRAMCMATPGRFHLLGLNWLRAIEELCTLAASFDTSKWLDGGRYGHVIFTNTRTGRLSAAPARHIPQYASMTRAERCVNNAREMAAYVAKRTVKVIPMGGR